MTQRTVLVTGASSGIGQATARLLAARGFTVFGTSRNPSGAETTPGLEMLPLDVRLDESVSTCMDAVLKQTGRLDVLINNAGYGLRGAIEEAGLEETKAQFETNFWGVVRMVKAVLPTMRRQGSGQIVNISSVAGMMGVPFAGFYAASKFAVEGYTEALRHEVKPFNIRVSLVEPYYVKSDFVRNWQPAADQIEDYAPWRERAAGVAQQSFDKASEPTLVAECVLRVLNHKTPRLRHPVGRTATSLVWLRRLLPEPVFERAVRRRLQLQAKD